MIVLSYPGIGRTEFAKKHLTTIDLDAAKWQVWCEDDVWYIPYVQQALDLSDQGYVVFIDSNEEVREFVSQTVDPREVWAIFPKPELYQEWMERIKDEPIQANDLFKMSGYLAKDCKDFGWQYSILHSMDYSLEMIFHHILNYQRSRDGREQFDGS